MLEERLDQMVRGRGVHSAIVDLSGCGYLSSTGIGVLVKTQRALQSRRPGKGGRAVIVGMRPFIRRLFDAANLSGLFEFADTVEAAKGLLLADPGERDA